jgi:hypothetical protein
MPRYNTLSTVNSLSTTSTLTAPNQGLYTAFTGTGGYTVTVPNPVLYFGQIQTFYNSSSGVVTLSTPSGVFSGSGTSTLAVASLQTTQIISDGTNYTVIVGTGGPATLTSATIGVISHSTTNTISTTGTTGLNLTAGGNLALTTSNSAYNVTVPYPNLGQASTQTAVVNKRYSDSLLTTSFYWSRSW